MSLPPNPKISWSTSAKELKFLPVVNLDKRRSFENNKSATCLVFYTWVCKLTHVFISQDQQLLFVSNMDQSFIIRKSFLGSMLWQAFIIRIGLQNTKLRSAKYVDYVTNLKWRQSITFLRYHFMRYFWSIFDVNTTCRFQDILFFCNLLIKA